MSDNNLYMKLRAYKEGKKTVEVHMMFTEDLLVSCVDPVGVVHDTLQNAIKRALIALKDDSPPAPKEGGE